MMPEKIFRSLVIGAHKSLTVNNWERPDVQLPNQGDAPKAAWSAAFQPTITDPIAAEREALARWAAQEATPPQHEELGHTSLSIHPGPWGAISFGPIGATSEGVPVDLGRIHLNLFNLSVPISQLSTGLRISIPLDEIG